MINRLLSAIAFSFLLNSPIVAQNKVVVIPLGGDSLPQYRIVPHEDIDNSGELIANGRDPSPKFGRLEWTNDRSPNAQSVFGKVCDDRIQDSTAQQKLIANFSCRAMGFAGGNYRTSFATVDGPLRTILDQVVCPENATKFEDCSFNDLFVEDCEAGEDEAIGVDCYTNTRLELETRFPNGTDITFACPPPPQGFLTAGFPALLEIGPDIVPDQDPLPAGATRQSFQVFLSSDFGDFRYNYRIVLDGVGEVARGQTNANTCDIGFASQSASVFSLAGRNFSVRPVIISSGTSVTLKSIIVEEI